MTYPNCWDILVVPVVFEIGFIHIKVLVYGQSYSFFNFNLHIIIFSFRTFCFHWLEVREVVNSNLLRYQLLYTDHKRPGNLGQVRQNTNRCIGKLANGRESNTRICTTLHGFLEPFYLLLFKLSKKVSKIFPFYGRPTFKWGKDLREKWIDLSQQKWDNLRNMRGLSARRDCPDKSPDYAKLTVRHPMIRS